MPCTPCALRGAHRGSQVLLNPPPTCPGHLQKPHGMGPAKPAPKQEGPTQPLALAVLSPAEATLAARGRGEGIARVSGVRRS